jgi:protein TonB
MSYQALLFCPDEKTARVVTQVLSELEFSVEPCSEPFAAVKKLMAQHFDAIVVNCDNEQNAALLFKSARNSGSNQTSLSVAVVEGQVGVAKAFRLGANLVLTKPIHVEQSKATLRVARGLLRKGQAAKAASTGSVIPGAVTLPSLPAPVPLQAGRASAPPPVASASAFEVEAEPNPQPDTVDAALLEYMPDSAPSSLEDSQPSATDSTQSKQYPWQPRKPMAEPMASALRRAAEVAGKNEFENPAGHSAAPQAGAAAAPARAREVTPFESKSVVAARPAPSEPVDKTSQDQSAAATLDSHSPAQTVHAPSFASLDDRRNPSAVEREGGSKKTLLAAVVLLAVAAAGYLGWTKMQSRQPEPAPHSLAPAEAATAALPPAPAPSATEAQPPVADVVTQTPEQSLSAPSALPSSKPSAAVVGESPALKTPTAAKPAGAEGAVAPLKVPAEGSLPAQPLVVKNDLSPQRQREAVAQEPEQPPTATSIATGSDSSALTGLVNTNAVNAQKAAQQTLRISQGVSEGLILKRVQPIYPPQALQMHLEGVVELQASISKAGNITGIKQLSGQAMLGRAAMDAVRQWKYRPYYLNGEPIEIQTQITVNFKLP